MSLADELEKLQRLRQANALTDEEFQLAKKKVLRAQGPETPSSHGPDVSAGVDPRMALSIAIWATFACVLVFGVFRVSWDSPITFLITVAGLSWLAFYGTKRVWADPTSRKPRPWPFRSEERDGQPIHDEEPVAPPPAPPDEPKDERFQA